MNRQGPGKIEWTDYTWSPVTGCKHGCSYCYANRIAQRIYPEKFAPTFRPERLKELAKLKQPSKIFVCDMGDLFGDWVPADWIIDVLESVWDYPEHTFQFLTKNPERYTDFVFPENCWLGTTVESEQEAFRIQQLNHAVHVDDNIAFVSFEPLCGKVMSTIEGLDWIIIGEQTGTAMSQEKIHTIRGWADDLILRAKMSGIPVFVKNALGVIFPQREFPTDATRSKLNPEGDAE